MRDTFSRIRKSEFIRNFLTLVSATSVAQGIAILIYPVLTRIYTPGEHGLFALYMSIIAITGIMSTGKYDLAVLMPSEKKDSLALVRLAGIICLSFSIFLVIPTFLLNKPFARILGNEEIGRWLYFVPLSTLLVGIFQTLSVWANREKSYKLIAGANLSQSVVNSGVKLSTSRFLPSGGGLITGAIAGQLVGALVFVVNFFRREGKPFRSVSREEVQAVARTYSLFPKYNLIHYLVNNFSTNLPVFVFSAWFSKEITGLYSLAFMMINRPMNLVTSSMGQVLSQRVIERYNRGELIAGDIRRMTLRLFLIGVVPFLLTGIFGPQIFSFVFGDVWFEAGKFMQLLLPWLFAVFISSPLTFLPDLLKRQKKAMWIDNIKFLLRISVLAIGTVMGNATLAIVLFSAVSFIMVLYNLWWCVSLAVKSDRGRQAIN
ncbi:MAG: lipopolysaccharide biosynthesis protein [Bacteroidota bacterium]